jgi:hypothetical protein
MLRKTRPHSPNGSPPNGSPCSFRFNLRILNSLAITYHSNSALPCPLAPTLAVSGRDCFRWTRLALRDGCGWSSELSCRSGKRVRGRPHLDALRSARMGCRCTHRRREHAPSPRNSTAHSIPHARHRQRGMRCRRCCSAWVPLHQRRGRHTFSYPTHHALPSDHGICHHRRTISRRQDALLAHWTQ